MATTSPIRHPSPPPPTRAGRSCPDRHSYRPPIDRLGRDHGEHDDQERQLGNGDELAVGEVEELTDQQVNRERRAERPDREIPSAAPAQRSDDRQYRLGGPGDRSGDQRPVIVPRSGAMSGKDRRRVRPENDRNDHPGKNEEHQHADDHTVSSQQAAQPVDHR
ncbi:hypothetical protein [Jongsikchunia kroppenstedtii]|uniref:hypothetical protein n=1 Tax=Jongsikchunia kroppenstedtii TaxID=1121721 RepID=UPI000365802A|nr:hypothetical protein [Jongsikchunia kroppenstedtii]